MCLEPSKLLKRSRLRPSTPLRYAQGEREYLGFVFWPFVLNVAQRAKSKHERLFQHPATAYSLKSTASSGLTVLELVVAMGVAGLFYGVLYNFYLLHARALKVQEIKLDLQESSRLAIDFLVRELHFAGARPIQGTGCPGFERLTNAESQRITLQYDYRGNSTGSTADGCPDDPNERIVYVYEPDTQLIKRASGGGAPQPFIGDVPSSGFLMRYFDRDGTDLGSPLNADQRAAVRSIVVTVRTSKRHPDPQITEPLTSEHTSTIFLPNPAR